MAIYEKQTAFANKLPTSAQKDALAGEGTPSASNKFVTKSYADSLVEKQSYYESLTIVTQNVVPNLTNNAYLNSALLFVDGFPQPGNFYSVTGNAVTWNNGTAGFNLEPGDDVRVFYFILNNHTPRYEAVSVTSLNTLDDLTYTPVDSSDVLLIVDTSVMPQTYYSIINKTITWDETEAGFDLVTTDVVWASYDSID